MNTWSSVASGQQGWKSNHSTKIVQLIYPLEVTLAQPELEPETQPKNSTLDDSSNPPTCGMTRLKRDSAL